MIEFNPKALTLESIMIDIILERILTHSYSISQVCTKAIPKIYYRGNSRVEVLWHKTMSLIDFNCMVSEDVRHKERIAKV